MSLELTFWTSWKCVFRTSLVQVMIAHWDKIKWFAVQSFQETGMAQVADNRRPHVSCIVYRMVADNLVIQRMFRIFMCQHSKSYHQISNISCTKSPKLRCVLFRLTVVFVQYIEAWCWVQNEDVSGAAPTGYYDPTIVLPSKVRLILEVWWYLSLHLSSSLLPLTYLLKHRLNNHRFM